ncbi:MAG: hypothetical protein ACOCV2_00755 [Persicimonas sp.]
MCNRGPSMLELIWRFELASLDDESVVRPLMAALEEVPDFSPDEYDLNQKEQWRTFDLDRAVVDALTQRTQLVRIADRSRDQLALVALGKHDEQPTAIVRLQEGEQPELEKLVAAWPELYESLPLESTLVSSSNWRRALLEADLPRELTGDLLGMVFGWRRGAEPSGLTEVAEQIEANAPARLDREANHLVLWLTDAPRVGGADHRRTLRAVARTLSRAGA